MDRNHFKIQCMWVYLQISVNTRSFENCSMHNSHLFHPHSVWFLLQQTICSTKFRSPNKLLNFAFSNNFPYPKEILGKFCCPWNKMPYKSSHVCTRFQWYGNNGRIAILTKIHFLWNITQFWQSSAKFALITFAQYCKTACARMVSMLYYWHDTHFVIYMVSVS